ncbi:hypothetical protein DMUE_5238 [Dictyocoela muelleri]|nr:hypothetical protein DMUE_5238 [Dictyocoela muelleri]
MSEVCENITIIYSDEWAGYRRVIETFKHRTINHSLGFVDHVTGVHTKNIESLWNSVKLKFKSMKGIHREHLQSYLDEFIWRNNYTNDIFERLLQILSRFNE